MPFVFATRMGSRDALFILPFNPMGVHSYSATLAGASFLLFTLTMGGLSR